MHIRDLDFLDCLCIGIGCSHTAVVLAHASIGRVSVGLSLGGASASAFQ